MLHCGIFFFSVLSLVLGNLPSPFKPTSEDGVLFIETPNIPSSQTTASQQDANTTDDDEVMGFCFFKSFPTATCMVECFFNNRSAYCDDSANCRCGTENEEDIKRPFRAPQEDHFTTLQADYDTEDGVVGVCYFGNIPSPYCVFRCSIRGQSSACDEDSRCLCEDRSWKELIAPTHHSLDILAENVQDLELTKKDPEREEDGSAIFFIFDLSGLFDSKDLSVIDESKDNCSTHELWTVPHIVAMAVLTLVAILLVLELTLCCKRRYSHSCKQQLQTVFCPELLEKGIVNEKN